MLIYKHQCIDIHLWIAMLLVYLLIFQLPAQFIISIVLLGQAISIISEKLTNHNFHLFLFWGPLKPVDANGVMSKNALFSIILKKSKLALVLVYKVSILYIFSIFLLNFFNSGLKGLRKIHHCTF